MKRRKSGFTIVELLTVLGIIAVLVGLLVPALSMVRRTAKETAQKAQLTAIDMALIAFKNDYGDYPPSEWIPVGDYCGAQKLAEALLGWDLLGFHPDSAWRADGLDRDNGSDTYDPDGTRDNNGDGILDTLNERKGPYLDLETANAFKLGISASGKRDGLFDDTGPLDPNTFVLCDSFGAKKITVRGKTVKAGTPILYYKADTSSKTISPPAGWEQRIYKAYDNLPLIGLGRITDSKEHELIKDGDPENLYNFDYEGGIRDPKIEARPWPYRPDSYILISAGADGLYGTSDDICNFGK